MNDDDQTACHLAEMALAPGGAARPIHILRVPPAPTADPNRRWCPTRSIASLLEKALGVPLLSRSVSRELIAYGSRFASRLDGLVRAQMPRLQRYLRHAAANREEADGMPSYEAICAAVEPLLPSFRVVVADEVFVLLTLGDAVTGRIPQKAAVAGPVLHVAASAAEDYAAVFTELSRMFGAGTAPSSAPSRAAPPRSLPSRSSRS